MSKNKDAINNMTSFIIVNGLNLLMRLPQQVINRLHWVERQNRDFDEDGDPVGHGAVPEARELHGFQVFAVFRLH